jgi:hypothetical protein
VIVLIVRYVQDWLAAKYDGSKCDDGAVWRLVKWPMGLDMADRLPSFYRVVDVWLKAILAG